MKSVHQIEIGMFRGHRILLEVEGEPENVFQCHDRLSVARDLQDELSKVMKFEKHVDFHTINTLNFSSK